MSSRVRTLAAALLAASLLGPLLPGEAPRAADAGAVTVVVKKTSVRRDRQFYAPAVAEASYGDRLTVLGREGDWVRVKAGGATGWVHASAVTAKAVKVEEKLSAPVPPGFQEGEDRDVALAGKGFNPQVEKEYRKKNPGANYAAVDRMEKIGVSEQAIAEFGREGHLTPRGGR